MTAARKKKESAVEAPIGVVPSWIEDKLASRDAKLEEKIDAIAALTASIYEALHRIDPKTHKRTASPIPSNATLKARVGRAARRAGLTFEEYVSRYGMVDAPSKAKKAKRSRKAKR